MKRILLGFAAFTLLATSCQKSAVVDDISDGQNELTYGVYQGKATKAAELKNSDLNKENVTFPLYAYKGAQNAAKTAYFTDKLTYTGAAPSGVWKTELPRFFPEGDTKLQFYAYFPSDGVTNYTEELNPNNFPTFKYTIQGETAAAGTTTDFVVASVNDNAAKSVTIPFKHALSQINFGVKGYYGAKITISNIKINQVYSAGTYTFGNPGSWVPETDADYVYKFGNGTTAAASTFTTPGGVVTDGTWSDANAEGDNRYIFGDGGNWGPSNGATPTVKETIWYIKADNLPLQASTINAQTATLKNSLMLMPQALRAGTTKAFVTFEYKIQDLDGNYVAGTATNTVVGKFDLNMGNAANAYADEWKPNMRYIYIIDFTGYLNQQKLTFDVDVESNPWENYNPDDGDDGIVLLESTGEPIFKTSIQGLSNGGTFAVPAGHVFSNIKWDWSGYEMTNAFTTGQTFTLTFNNVRYNGNEVTVFAPFGFQVAADAAIYGASAVAKQGVTTLTFKASADYYLTAAAMNTKMTAAGNFTFNASNKIKLADVKNAQATAGNTIIVNFAAPYAPATAGWVLSNGNKTATFTK